MYGWSMPEDIVVNPSTGMKEAVYYSEKDRSNRIQFPLPTEENEMVRMLNTAGSKLKFRQAAENTFYLKQAMEDNRRSRIGQDALNRVNLSTAKLLSFQQKMDFTKLIVMGVGTFLVYLMLAGFGAAGMNFLFSGNNIYYFILIVFAVLFFVKTKKK